MKKLRNKDKPLLSIIIVKYKCDEYLKKCLNSVAGDQLSVTRKKLITDNRSLITEVIVVDNDKKNLGYGGGCNKGAKQAKGKYLFFLNPDTELLPGTLETLVSFMEENPQVGVVGPKIYCNKHKERQLSFCRFPDFLMAIGSYSPIRSLWPNNPWWYKYSYLNLQGLALNKPVEVDAVSGAAMMVRKEAFEKVGGFDSNFFLFFEENDLCRRIQKQGYKIMFLPAAEIVHWGSKSMTNFNQRDQIFRQSRAYFLKKHLGLKGVLSGKIIETLEVIALLRNKLLK